MMEQVGAALEILSRRITQQVDRQWILEKVAPYLEGWDAEDVAVLVESKVSLWDMVPREAKEELAAYLPLLTAAFPSVAKASEFLLELLGEMRPDLARVITRECLQSELQKAIAEAT